jgi:hypothetical protein
MSTLLEIYFDTNLLPKWGLQISITTFYLFVLALQYKSLYESMFSQIHSRGSIPEDLDPSGSKLTPVKSRGILI